MRANKNHRFCFYHPKLRMKRCKGCDDYKCEICCKYQEQKCQLCRLREEEHDDLVTELAERPPWQDV